MAIFKSTLASFNLSDSDVTKIYDVIGDYANNSEVSNDVIKSMAVVMSACLNNPELSPQLPSADYTSYAQEWAKKYLRAYQNRPSKRISGPITTTHDTIQNSIIKSRLSHLEEEDIKKIKYAHRLLMSAENISGDLLEEFLSINLLQYGWHCCWGMTIKKVDFCNQTGELLQIKNSDNSENSSSKTVRNETTIQHWFRRKSKTGETNWMDLRSKLNLPENNILSEEKFQEFVKSTVTTNPECLFVENDNLWFHPPIH